MRISEHPILSFQRGRAVSFTFDGQEIQGFEGEPVAAAVLAAGIKALSTSLKLERKRGFFCAVGNCSSCLVRVDGVPNVRACLEPLRAGMRVETQPGKARLTAPTRETGNDPGD